jgi:hypothetical protein
VAVDADGAERRALRLGAVGGVRVEDRALVVGAENASRERWCGLQERRCRRHGSGGPTSSGSRGGCLLRRRRGRWAGHHLRHVGLGGVFRQGSAANYVGSWNGFLPGDGGLETTHRAGQGPVPSSLIREYDVMIRNT